MDKLIYVSMAGAKNAMQRQETVSNNLANLSTSGFRAEIAAYRTAPVLGQAMPTRAYAAETTTGADFTPGVIHQTGRSLDVAINGKGFLAVQAADGNEAYTRNGHLEVDAGGQLMTANGLQVQGEGGPIVIPPDHEVKIADDGTVSAVPKTGSRASVINVGKLKLVDPDPKTMTRGGDGLFRSSAGDAETSPTVKVANGALESSNVNAVEAMIDMISLSRQFDTHMKLLQNAEQSDKAASQLLASA
ncbi:flagellar basal-body rod protein FlgF [Ampullimonas aquatilis]|uniref:flagellar basal-body rod protein FlgF n=1 Tax=Ampullimonas aquatilis TaxID=1341549 RepID=UPI003C70F15A